MNPEYDWFGRDEHDQALEARASEGQQDAYTASTSVQPSNARITEWRQSQHQSMTGGAIWFCIIAALLVIGLMSLRRKDTASRDTISNADK
jgi:hypothetical protein